MTDREEMAALADELMSWHDACTQNSAGGDGQFRVECSSGSDAQARGLRSSLRRAAAALRSASRTGPPDEADNGILNAAKFVASQDREMLAQMLFALHERHDSPSPVRFNCGWKQLKSFNRASFYRCSDAIRAIAALPAPAGESVTGWHTTGWDRARNSGRILLVWRAFGGISEHVELGKYSDSKSAWTNTYGHPFSSDPDGWSPLQPFTITRKSKNEEAGS